MQRFFRSVFFVGIASCAFVSTRAQAAAPVGEPTAFPTQPASGTPKAKPSPEQIRSWINDLDDDVFATRQSAVQKLIETGAPAVDAVAAAAAGTKLEATLNAIDILRKLAQGPDATAKEPAKSALENLAKSENKALAERATAALQPAPSPADKTADGKQNADPFGGQTIVLGGGGVIVKGNVRIIGGGAANVRMESRSSDGNRTLEVRSGDETVRIEETKDSITVTNIKTAKDKEEKVVYKAKDLDELKEKQPEGFKIYEKYGQAKTVDAKDAALRAAEKRERLAAMRAQAEVQAKENAIKAEAIKAQAQAEIEKAKNANSGRQIIKDGEK